MIGWRGRNLEVGWVVGWVVGWRTGSWQDTVSVGGCCTPFMQFVVFVQVLVCVCDNGQTEGEYELCQSAAVHVELATRGFVYLKYAGPVTMAFISVISDTDKPTRGALILKTCQ